MIIRRPKSDQFIMYTTYTSGSYPTPIGHEIVNQQYLLHVCHQVRDLPRLDVESTKSTPCKCGIGNAILDR